MPYTNGTPFNPITSFGKEAPSLKWGTHIPQFHSQDKIVFGKTYDTKTQVNPIVHDSEKPPSFYSSIKGYENRGFPPFDNTPVGSRIPITNPEGTTTTHLIDTIFINSRLPRLVGPRVETESPYKGSYWGAYKQRGSIKS